MTVKLLTPRHKGPRHQDGVMFERGKGESSVKEGTKERRHLYLKRFDAQTIPQHVHWPTAPPTNWAWGRSRMLLLMWGVRSVCLNRSGQA